MSALVGTSSNVDRHHAQECHPPDARDDGPAPYEFSACHMPVAWPMHTGTGVDGGAVTMPGPVVMAPQNQAAMSPEVPNGAVAGGMMWIQPVFWPMYSTNDGMQVGVPWDTTQGSDMKGMPFHQGRQQTGVGNFGVRKQRRSKRNSCQAGTRIASDAAMCPEELEELRRAVQSTKQALDLRNSEQALQARNANEESVTLPTAPADAKKHIPSPKTLKQFTRKASATSDRWADANDEAVDEDEEGEASSLASLDTADSLNDHCDAGSKQASTWHEPCGIATVPANLGRPEQIENVNLMPDANCAEEAAMDAALLELENVGANFRSTMDWVVSTAWPLALTRNGCRVVQKAIDVGRLKDQKAIAEELHGRVLEATLSPHANHVLQKCIEILPCETMFFVLTELQGNGAFAARHRFGCRILQRLIEHCPASQAEGIIAEVMAETATLCRHQYGNFVIQHILQHASAAHRSAVAEILCEDTIRLAKHRVASHVLSCAMVHCSPEDVHKLAQVVGSLQGLSRREYGSFVVREVNRAARKMQEASLQE